MSARAAVAPASAGFTEREYEFEPRPAFRAALVVDDNPDITDVLATMLRCAGYTVSRAHSASDALAMAITQHFDLVVSDIRLPGMSGHEGSVAGIASATIIRLSAHSTFSWNHTLEAN